MPRPSRPAHGTPDWDSYLESVFDDIYQFVVRPLFVTPGSFTASPAGTALTGTPVTPLATYTAALPAVGSLFTLLPVDPASTTTVPGFTFHGDGSGFTLDHDGLYRLDAVSFGTVHLSAPPTGNVEIQLYLQQAINPVFDPSVTSDLVARDMDTLQGLSPAGAPTGYVVSLAAASYAFYCIAITHDPLDDSLTWDVGTPLQISFAELLRSP